MMTKREIEAAVVASINALLDSGAPLTPDAVLDEVTDTGSLVGIRPTKRDASSIRGCAKFIIARMPAGTRRIRFAA